MSHVMKRYEKAVINPIHKLRRFYNFHQNLEKAETVHIKIQQGCPK